MSKGSSIGISNHDTKIASHRALHRQTPKFKLDIATTQLAAFYPLHTADKLSQAIAPWNELYELIGFTTLDSHTEKSFFNHPATAALIPATVPELLFVCEVSFEIFCARQICHCADLCAELLRFPIHVFYEHTAALEWHALTAVLGQSPTNVAILGTGALPEMRVWIQDWARENRTRARVHNVELLEDRCELGRLAVSALGVDSDESMTPHLKRAMHVLFPST